MAMMTESSNRPATVLLRGLLPGLLLRHARS